MQWQIQGRGPRGPVPLVFRPNWGPKGTTTPPPLTKGLDDWASLLFQGMDPALICTLYLYTRELKAKHTLNIL